MNRIEIAEKMFKEGFNCTQSVLYSYANELNLSIDVALKIANGFGAGMGRKQEVCGAVSGAIMIIGLIYGRGKNDGKDKHENTYRKVQTFIDSFIQEFGTVNCKALLNGCCLLTEEGKNAFKEEKLIEQCYQYVKTACKILKRMEVLRDKLK